LIPNSAKKEDRFLFSQPSQNNFTFFTKILSSKIIIKEGIGPGPSDSRFCEPEITEFVTFAFLQ